MFQQTQKTDQSQNEDSAPRPNKTGLTEAELMRGHQISCQVGAPAQMFADKEEKEVQAKVDSDKAIQQKEEEEIQMKAPPSQMKEEEELVQGKAIQKAPEEEEEEVQMKESSGDNTQGTTSASSTQSTLPRDVNARMEAAFNRKFLNVNIHTNDSKATQMNALAFTQGNNVHFAPGQYNPHTSKGQELIGHEYTHVVQQDSGQVAPTTQAKGMSINDNPALENEADVMGKKAAEGKSADVSGVGSGVQKKENINNKNIKIKNATKDIQNIDELINNQSNNQSVKAPNDAEDDGIKSKILTENAKTVNQAPFPKAGSDQTTKWKENNIKYSNVKYSDGLHAVTLSPMSGLYNGYTKQTPAQFIDSIMEAIKSNDADLDCSLYTSVVLVSALKDYLFQEEGSHESFNNIFKQAIVNTKEGESYYNIDKVKIGGGFSGQGKVDGKNYSYLDHPWTMDPAKVSKHLKDAPMGTVISVSAISTSFLRPRTENQIDGFVARNQNLIKVDQEHYATNLSGSIFYTVEEIFARLIKGTKSPEQARYYLRSEIRYDFDKYKSNPEKK